MTTYVALCVAALVLSIATTSLAIRLSKALDLCDMPTVRKVHREPVPRIGGVSLFVSAVPIVSLVLLRFQLAGGGVSGTVAQMWTLIGGATIVFLLGLTDDIRPLRARLKLLVEFAAAMLVCWGGIRIDAIAVGTWAQVDLGWIAWPVTLFWIVGITNAVNISDGLDGLAAGISMIACSAVMVLALLSHQVLLAVLMVTLLGALAGFLKFNFHPARIFLGDSGSLFLGFVISSGGILCFMQSHRFSSLVLTAFAVAVPILDMAVSVVRRFVARRPIFAPDCGHIHHRLLELGLSQPHVVGIVCGLTLALCSLSTLTFAAAAWAGLALCVGLTCLLVLLFCCLGVVCPRTMILGLRSRLSLSHRTREEISEFCDLQLQFDGARSARAWWLALCRAAEKLEFAWVCVDIPDSEGGVKTYIWRRVENPPASLGMTLIRLPIPGLLSDAPIEVEVAVLTNGSVEGAVRRVSLFGRLMDEYRMPALEGMASGPGIGAEAIFRGITPTSLRAPSLSTTTDDAEETRSKASGHPVSEGSQAVSA